MTKALKLEHRLFIEHYLSNGYNMTKAYAATYPNASDATCRVNGSRLMKTQRIKDAVAASIDAIVGSPEELRRKILLELADMAFAQKDDEYYTPPIKHKAMDTLNKMSGAYTEKIEITNKTILVTLEDDDDDESTDGD